LFVPEVKDEDSDLSKIRCDWVAQHQITNHSIIIIFFCGFNFIFLSCFHFTFIIL